jgi:hypothetical protein
VCNEYEIVSVVEQNSVEDETEEDFEDEDGKLEFLEEPTTIADDLMYDSFNADIKTNLSNVRKIVKFFSASDIRNGILQSYVKQEFGKELKVFLDFNVRWHTIHKMLERFLKLKSAVKKALQELGKLEMYTALKFDFLEQLLEVLEPIVEASRTIEKSNTTLVESDLIMEILCKRKFQYRNSWTVPLKLKPSKLVILRTTKTLHKNLLYLKASPRKLETSSCFVMP